MTAPRIEDGRTTIDGRSIGYADPRYQPRFRVTYKPKGEGTDSEPRVLYAAQEKQDTLHSCAAPNIWFGGAAGGGKSHALRWHGIINCLRRGGLKVLLLRRQFKELESTHILSLQSELPSEIASWRSQLKRAVFTNGSILQLGHCHAEKDVRSYLSTAWDIILVDEASEFTPTMLSLLQSRLRTTLDGIRPQFCLASNPGGEAHLWLVSRFITKRVDPKEDGRYRPDDYQFIQSLVGDNRFNDVFYLDRLLSLPEAQREAYLFGNMEAFAGQYFREWAESLHVIPSDPSILEDWYEVEAGMDWGYDPHPGVVLWAAFDPHGRPILYKELKFNLSSPREVAEMIVARCTTEAERRMTIRGDSAMWIRQVGTGVSIADEINEVFAELGTGIILQQANKDRLNGWMRVHQFLDPRRPDPDRPGKTAPYLRMMRYDEHTGLGCPGLISTIGAQMHSEKQDGDMRKQTNDDFCDALRYLLMGRSPLSILPRELQPAPSHENRVRARTAQLIREAKARKLSQLAELDDSGLEVEDTPMVGVEADDDDGAEVIFLDGVEDAWN